MQAASFIREFVALFFGPLLWAMHFLGIYGFTALACARRFAHLELMGLGIVQWTITLLTVLAVTAISLFIWRYARDGNQGSSRFSVHTTVALGGLSIIAIIWEAMPAYLVPVC